ncbi:MAG: DUF29 domain-containing protein [Deltaproteobacteria bacterium]|nr:DUF29 domain-containing protein [Deltaproteobacteria bacterium]
MSEYNLDFFNWTEQQAEYLKAGKFYLLDIENLAEEIESMGRSERRELLNRLAVLLMHLLKWQYQPHLQTRSWKVTIRNQRGAILDLLEDSPSLKSVIVDKFAKAYQKARLNASDETGIPLNRFPDSCPWSVDRILEENFIPNIEAMEK